MSFFKLTKERKLFVTAFERGNMCFFLCYCVDYKFCTFYKISISPVFWQRQVLTTVFRGKEQTGLVEKKIKTLASDWPRCKCNSLVVSTENHRKYGCGLKLAKTKNFRKNSGNFKVAVVLPSDLRLSLRIHSNAGEGGMQITMPP